MSYVYQTPQQPQKDVTVRKRKRSPLGKLVAWGVKGLAGTALHKLMQTILIDSLPSRIAAAMTVSLVIGAVVDLSITLGHPFGIAATLQVPLMGSVSTTGSVLAALAGGGGGGPGGVVVGILWSWVVGKVVTATMAQTVAHFMPPVAIQVIGWLTATLAGWVAGRVASWCVAKLETVRPFLARGIGVIAVTAALASMAFVLLQFAIWLHPHLPEVLPLAAKVISIIWRPIVAVAVWVVVLVLSFGVSHSLNYRFDVDYRGYAYPRRIADHHPFHRKHPMLFATWLVFVSGVVLGTVALLLPEYLREAAYVLGGFWILGICLAAQWAKWGVLEDADHPIQWWGALLVLDITDSIQIDELLDLVMRCGGEFDIQDLRVGQHKTDPLVYKIEVTAPDAETVNEIVHQARKLGARSDTKEAVLYFRALPTLVDRLKQSVVSPWLMQRMPVLNVVYVAVLWSTPMLAMLSANPWVTLPWVLLLLSLFYGYMSEDPDFVLPWFILLGTLSVGSLYLVAFCVLFTATYVYTGFVGVISIDVILSVLLVVTAARWAIIAKYRHLVFTGVLAATLLGLNLDPSLWHAASAFDLALRFLSTLIFK